MNLDLTFSNKELITGCAQQKRVYQEALYRKYCPQMIRIGYRFTQDQELLIGWINNGFLKVFDKVSTLKGQSDANLDAWVRTVVYRSIIDGIRKEKKYWNRVLLDDNLTSSTSQFEEQFHEIDYNNLLETIDELDYKDKEVFQLYVFEGLNHREIAERLSISEGTSKWRLHEARKKIQEQLKLKGYARR